MALQHPSAAKVVMFVSSNKEDPSHQRWLLGRINAAALKAQVSPMPWRLSQSSQLDPFEESSLIGLLGCWAESLHVALPQPSL